MQLANNVLRPDDREDGLYLKDLISKIHELTQYLLSKWLTILIIGVVGVLGGLVFSLFKKKTYIAELTFVMEDSKSSALGAYSGLASQFGIDLMGNSASGVFSGDNVITFLKSRLIVQRSLLTEVTVRTKTMSLANLFMEANEYRDKWKGRPELSNISFPYGKGRGNFTLLQDSILNVLSDEIISKALNISKPDKKIGFILVKCNSRDEIFSKVFTETLVNEAIRFYTVTKNKKNIVSIDRLQAEADSIEFLLNKKTYSAAIAQDVNVNPAKRISSVSSELISRDKLILQTMYGEVIKNLEISKIAMAQETPIIQIVDTPILPLPVEKTRKIVAMAIGGIIAGFMAVLYLIGRRVYNQIME